MMECLPSDRLTKRLQGFRFLAALHSQFQKVDIILRAEDHLDGRQYWVEAAGTARR